MIFVSAKPRFGGHTEGKIRKTFLSLGKLSAKLDSKLFHLDQRNERQDI